MTMQEQPTRPALRQAWVTSTHMDMANSLKAMEELLFNASVKAFLAPLLKGKENPLLDVGSNPFYSTYIPGNIEVVALDWAIDGLPSSGERVIADVEQLPFPDGHFPVVLSKQVYGYLLDPDRLVQEMIRVLRRGGLFLLMDIEGEIAEYDQRIHQNVPRLHDFKPQLVEEQVRTIGIVNSSIRQIRSWSNIEVAPGVKRDVALTCLLGVKS